MKINIKGAIVGNDDKWIYDWLDLDAVSPRDVEEKLENLRDGEVIDVEINSGGGSVFDASEIYTALKRHTNKVNVQIVGMAASAASLIAMAGDKVSMAPVSQMMIHNATILAHGDYRDMDHTSNILKNVNQTVASAYKLKSGKTYDELLSMMDEETWMTPQQAKEHALIDEIMFEEQDLEIVASTHNMLPREVINKIKNEFHATVSKDKKEPDNTARKQATAKLNLLKLGVVDNEF